MERALLVRLLRSRYLHEAPSSYALLLQRGSLRRRLPQSRDFFSASSSDTLLPIEFRDLFLVKDRPLGQQRSRGYADAADNSRAKAESATYSTDRTTGAGEASSQEPKSSVNPTAQFLYRKVADTFQNATTSAGTAIQKLKDAKLVDSVRNGYSFLKEEMSNTSPRRKSKPPVETGNVPPENTSVSAIVPVVKKTTGWEKRWETLKEKARSHPAFKRLRTVKEHPVVAKGQDLAEDLRERWETSDSPVVHKIQDLNESIFGETATAVAMREIRRHDPSFTFSEFLAEVQEDVRPVLRAYLKGDLSTLSKKCSREVVDRCRAERRALESQGIFLDNKILHISDVEIKETKLLGTSPIIIVSFQTQQIYCARDKEGIIIEGAKDDIHTVYYAWAMQQVGPEEMEAGDLHRRWKLREMQQLGIQAII